MKIAMSQLTGSAALNLIIQPLWDTEDVIQAQSADISLFTVPIGQGTPQKSLVDTNMGVGGSLPAPNRFYLRAFLVYPVPRSAAGGTFAIQDVTDMSRFLDQCIFTFRVGTSGRSLVQAHCRLFPCGLGLQGMVTAGGGATVSYVLGNGVRELANRFGLGDYAEVLNPTEAFRGTFSFPAGTLTSSATLTVCCYLAGITGQSVG